MSLDLLVIELDNQLTVEHFKQGCCAVTDEVSHWYEGKICHFVPSSLTYPKPMPMALSR